jgi:YVTN family beta-propeller protein
MASPSAGVVIPISMDFFLPERVIYVGLHPYDVTASPGGDRIYVSNFYSNDVSVIDTDPMSPDYHKVIATIPVGRNPTALAASPDGRTLYSVTYGDSSLTIIDVDPTSASAYSAKAKISVGSSSSSVAVTPDGGRILVGTSYGLLVIQAEDTSARTKISTSSSTGSVAVTPDGGLAVLVTTLGEIILIDIVPGSPQEFQAKAKISVSTSSGSVAVSPDGGFVYVTDPEGSVRVFKLLGGGSAARANREFSSSNYSLVPQDTIAVGEDPSDIVFDPLGSGTLLVVNAGDNSVSVVSAMTGSVPDPEIETALPVRVQLLANTPNPFTQATVIAYELTEPVPVSLRVFDIQGRLVRVLEDAPLGEPGRHALTWDARDDRGVPVSTGIYFYRLTAGDFRQARRMLLLR